MDKIEPPLSIEQKAHLYDIYSFTLRTGHIGQAFDIYGQQYMMVEDIMVHGDVDRVLERQVACTHRMKSAVPAGCLARMGAYVGGASGLQNELLGSFFEAVGLAFQVMDDVLNLAGFPGDTKQRGEDIMAGKVTFPIAVAMRVGAPGGEKRRREILQILKSAPQDLRQVERCISLVEASGGMEGSRQFARQLVDSAWAEMDAHIPDSFHKLMLRAFGTYVLERHY
jgi:geranylgeranyl pyrophosphate synthase